jgi:hypothetical protein
VYSIASLANLLLLLRNERDTARLVRIHPVAAALPSKAQC